MSNYTKNQFVEEKNNSWSMVYDYVNESEKILDIGCSSGNFGERLTKSKGCQVDGIDIDEKDVTLAKAKLHDAWLLNVETDSLASIKTKYDAILMMDVIEHLQFPAETLHKVSKLLKSDGRLIFSVPNMSHVSVRLELLKGQFDYRQVGILDDTHLHFYTEATLRNVFARAGYVIQDFACTSVTYPKEVLRSQLNKAGLTPSKDFITKLTNTNGNVYQFIGEIKVAAENVAQKKVAALPSMHPHEQHYTEIDDVIADQRKYLNLFKKEIKLKQQHIDNLENKIALLSTELEQLKFKKIRRVVKKVSKS